MSMPDRRRTEDAALTDTSIRFWPREVILGITSRCNFRCTTCNPHRNDKAGESASGRYVDMPDEIFEKLEDVIRHAETVTLGGVGEPSITRNFYERAERIHELNPKVQVITFTNGSTLVNTKIAERFARVINYLHISFNGWSSYETIMVGGKLDHTLRNLRILRDVRRRTGRPQRLELGVVLGRNNADDLVRLAELARELEFDRIAFKDMWVFDEGLKTESLRHDPDLADRIREGVIAARKVGVPVRCEPWPELSTGMVRPKQFLHCASGAMSAGSLWPNGATVSYWSTLVKNRLAGRFGGRKPWRDEPAHDRAPICRDPWDKVQVSETGDVLLCCEGLSVLGNISDSDFASVWNGEKARRYREGMLTRDYYGACRTCKVVNPDVDAFMRENG